MARLLRSTAAFGVLLALAGASGHAQAPQTPAPQTPAQPAPTPDDPQQPVFRAGINFVRVDVIVSDKDGNPVADLKPEDFEVVEQGQAQKIETFKLISLDGGLIPGPDGPPRDIRTDLDEEMEANRDDVRLFGIFLDDYHVRRESSMVARDQIARFVETQLGPSDMIGMMYPLQPVASVRMTRNHPAIMRGLQEFWGRKFDYTPQNDLEQRYAYYPTEIVENIRNEVSLSAIEGMIVHMGGLKEGRKALILVSEGYSGMIPPQMRDRSAAIGGIDNPNRNNPNAGLDSPMEDRISQAANFNMDNRLRELTDLANRNNVAIYAVDPRGLATNEFGIDQNINIRTDRQYLNNSIETLRTMAINTDGRAIVNRNDLTVAMKQIVRDSSAYYLLGYNSTFTATDGKFHQIRVRVKRPGVQVRSRPGYWAYSAQDAARAAAPPAPEVPKAYSSAIAAISQPARSRLVRTWIGNDRGANGKTKVTVLWEPLPRPAGAPARATEVPARVSVTAVAPDGSPYFRGRSPDSAAPVPAPATGAKVSFEVPPGKMQLRLSVESADNEVLDSEVREIEIPDLTGPRVWMSTPQVFRARTVREFQQIKVDAQATPTAAREFSRMERVFIRVSAYAPSGQAPLAARLLNRTGQQIASLPVAAAGVGAGASDIELTLNTVPPGEYIVEITAQGDGGPATEVIGFRITG